MVRDLHLAGVCVTNDNVVDGEQVRATTAAVSEAVADDGRTFPAVIGVDQEGGLVAHLRGVATDFPAFAEAGEAIAADPGTGEQVVTDAARSTALELRQLGFTWVFAPVADVTIGAADPTIGTRSPSSDPALAAEATAAAVTGYDEAGLVSTTKHFPGHGGVTADSHEMLPVLDATLEELEARDLRPFEAAVAAHAPAVMMSHLDVEALAPGTPASLAPTVYDYLRDELGFEGVTITDSLGMGAVAGRDMPAVTALNAGADLLLMPVDTRNTHAVVTDAIESGRGQPGAGRGGRRPGGRPPALAAASVGRRARPGGRHGARPGRRRGPGGRGGVRAVAQAARSGSPSRRSFCSASRSSWRTRSAEMPCFTPMSASLCWRPSVSP